MHRIRRAKDLTCHCNNNKESTAEHVFLHCPAIPTHRDIHQVHALEHIWERPLEIVVGYRFPQGCIYHLKAQTTPNTERAVRALDGPASSQRHQYVRHGLSNSNNGSVMEHTLQLCKYTGTLHIQVVEHLWESKSFLRDASIVRDPYNANNRNRSVV